MGRAERYSAIQNSMGNEVDAEKLMFFERLDEHEFRNERAAVIRGKKLLEYLKGNLMGRQPEGKWFERTGDEPPSLYAEPNYNWSLGEIDPPGIGGKEFVKAAAIKLKNGRIFEGASHHIAMDEFDKVHSGRDWKKLVDDADGFITSEGRFITRDEAVKLTGQKSEDAADIIGRSL